jgi:hypothetical protein
MSIVQFNVDKAEWVGDEQDGCYVQVQHLSKGPDLAAAKGIGAALIYAAEGWYCTVVVDCDSAGFVADLHTDAGPFESKDEALEYGHAQAADWCLANQVSFT